MKITYIYFSYILVIIFFSTGYADQKIINPDLNNIINNITGGGIDSQIEKIADIAAEGDQAALQILRDLREHPRPSKWKAFKEKYGYPKNALDWSSMSFKPDNLQIALAIAGDEEAWEEIVDEFERADEGIENPVDRRQRDEVLDKMAQVGTPKAVQFVASQLERDNVMQNAGLLSDRAAETLRKMVSHPEAERMWKEVPYSDGMYKQHTRFWKSWWERNRVRYEKAIAEGIAVEEVAIRLDSLDDLNPKPTDSEPTLESPPPTPPSSPQKPEPAVSNPPPSEPSSPNQLPWIIGALIFLAATAWGFLKMKRT